MTHTHTQHKLKKHLMASIIGIATICSTSAAMANCDPGEQVIKFSHVTNADKHPKGIAANLLQQRINHRMNGNVCMEVYPNSTLYNDVDVFDAMLEGEVHLAAPSLSRFEGYTKKFRIFDLPFMFKNIKAVDRFQSSERGQALKDSMQEQGLQGLTFWHNGMKQFSANVPLLLPTDAAGLKFRVQPSDVLVAQIEALQAQPERLALSQVYDALQNGMVDGQENSWSNIYGRKFYELQDGVTETNHGVLDYLVVTSTDWLNALDPETRTQFLRTLDEVTRLRNKASFKVNLVNRQSIIKAGGKVRILSKENRETWVEAMKPVWKKFEQDVGVDNIEAVQEINARL